MKLYVHGSSGNCYKVRLLCAQLGREIEVVDVGPRGERSAEFVAKSFSGRVPLLELEDGRTLSESSAILTYLAEGSHLLPDDSFDRAQVLQWMFFEQNLHEPYVATSIFLRRHYAAEGLPTDLLDHFAKKGREALEVMERRLQDQEWFAAGRCTIADIALFGYTHKAEEGGFSLEDCPRVREWITRFREQPGWLPPAELSTADGLPRS